MTAILYCEWFNVRATPIGTSVFFLCENSVPSRHPNFTVNAVDISTNESKLEEKKTGSYTRGFLLFRKLQDFTFLVESRQQWIRSVVSWCTWSRQQVWKRTTSSRGTSAHSPRGATSFAREHVPTLRSGAGACTSSTDKLGQQVWTNTPHPTYPPPPLPLLYSRKRGLFKRFT